ncbi:MAG: LysE family transporter, partial [Pseudomonadota bacterium]
WTAAGIATGSFLWAGAAALGIASVLEALPILGLVLKVGGVAYLIYLGVKLLRSNGFQPTHDGKTIKGSQGYGRGLIVNMTNPKSAAYYASVFAAFLTPDMPIWVLAVLIVAIGGMSAVWHAVLAIGFSTPLVQRRYIRSAKWLDRICGAVLVLLGLRLALDAFGR